MSIIEGSSPVNHDYGTIINDKHNHWRSIQINEASHNTRNTPSAPVSLQPDGAGLPRDGEGVFDLEDAEMRMRQKVEEGIEYKIGLAEDQDEDGEMPEARGPVVEALREEDRAIMDQLNEEEGYSIFKELEDPVGFELQEDDQVIPGSKQVNPQPEAIDKLQKEEGGLSTEE